MAEWLDWAGCSASSADSFLDWRPDPLADGLAKRALRHLTSERQMERLTFEATCLSLAERAIERLRVEMGQRSIDMSVGTAPLTTNLRRAIEWAEAHLSDQSLSVSGMARAAGLSASQFTVAFRAATRETPYAFVLRRRAERAVQMLRDSDRSIAQIAFDCGFSSSAHAGTVVKKHFGVTPGEIRRSLG
ncbi:MAG: AraC family transcriptional regulator [Pseudomonadota bacterium]